MANFYVRILPKKQFIKRIGRFASVAFKNLRGGISVIQRDCIIDGGRTICGHLTHFYKSLDESPHVFWAFDADVILPEDVEFEQEDSHSGDICHYNIRQVSNGKAKKIFTEHFETFRDAQICDGEAHRILTEEDISEFFPE